MRAHTVRDRERVELAPPPRYVPAWRHAGGSELIIVPWTGMIQSAQPFGHYPWLCCFLYLSLLSVATCRHQHGMSVSCAYATYWQYSVADFGWSVSVCELGRYRGGTVRHHHRYSVRHSIVQDGQTSAMAVRLANPQLVTTSDHFTQHRRPSTAVWHISIEELRSEQAVTTAP